MIDRPAWAGNRCKARTSMGGPVMVRLMDQSEETSTLPARYYRRKATEARRAAEGVTTRPIKARLQGLARDLDRLGDAADSAAQTRTRDPSSRPNHLPRPPVSGSRAWRLWTLLHLSQNCLMAYGHTQ